MFANDLLDLLDGNLVQGEDALIYTQPVVSAPHAHAIDIDCLFVGVIAHSKHRSRVV